MFIEDITKYLTEEWEKRIYGDASTVLTSYTDLVSDTVPEGYTGIVIELAADNTQDADIDFQIEGKSQPPYPINAQAFPANMEGIAPMTVIGEKKRYTLRAKSNTGASITLKWRMVVLLVKK